MQIPFYTQDDVIFFTNLLTQVKLLAAKDKFRNHQKACRLLRKIIKNTKKAIADGEFVEIYEDTVSRGDSAEKEL